MMHVFKAKLIFCLHVNVIKGATGSQLTEQSRTEMPVDLDTS